MSETKIKLTTPESIDGVKKSEVGLRAPKVKDLKAVQGLDDFEAEVKMIQILSGLAPTDLDNFSLVNFSLLQEGLKNFIPSSSQMKS